MGGKNKILLLALFASCNAFAKAEVAKPVNVVEPVIEKTLKVETKKATKEVLAFITAQYKSGKAGEIDERNSISTLVGNIPPENIGNIPPENIGDIPPENNEIIISDDITTSGEGTGFVADGSGTTVLQGNMQINYDDSGSGSVGAVATTGATLINEGNMYLNGDSMYDEVGGMLATTGNVNVFSAQNSTKTFETTVINKGTISGTGDYGMAAIGEGANAINEGDITGTYQKGMLASSGGECTNNGYIYITGDAVHSDANKFAGMNSDGTGSKSTNNGTIEVKGERVRGLQATSGGEVINSSKGVIYSSGFGSSGMSSWGNNSTAINYGTIYASGEKSNGMYAMDNATATNNSSIVVSGLNSRGMHASTGDFENSNSSILNNGSIEVEGKGTYGMHASTENSDDGKILAENSATGTINVNGIDSIGMSAYGIGVSAINNGSIKVEGEGSQGMYANSGGSVENGKLINIEGNNSKGMSADDIETSAINNGSVAINGNNSAGMYANNGGYVENGASGEINIEGNNSRGMGTDNIETSAINNGSIAINGNNSAGMYANNGGYVENGASGEINIEGNNSRGMGADGADGAEGIETSAINYGSITINGDNSVGMFAYDIGSSAINNGSITINGLTVTEYGSKGMLAYNGGSVENGELGEINIEGSNSVGMSAERIGSSAINYGSITINGSDSRGMHAYNGGSIENGSLGEINIEGNNSAGMFADGAGIETSAINYGSITINGSDSKGMLAYNGGYVENSGVINIEGNNTVGDKSAGMIADGPNSYAVNKGEININGTYNVGMASFNYGTIENQGIINLNGTYGIGMIASNSSQLINTGDINAVDSSNKDIVITENSTFMNSGALNYEESFDTSDLVDESSSFVMADGGTLNADSVSGDITVSHNIVNGYDNYGIENDAITTDDMDATVHSDSIMYDASYEQGSTENSYDLVMERNSFYEIIEDQDRAEFLESNFYSNGNKGKDDIYNEYQKAQTSGALDKMFSSTLGESIYPSIQQQTYDIIDFTNDTLLDTVFTPLLEGNFEIDTRYIGGFSLSSSNIDSSDDLEGYDSVLSAVYLGIDKKINSSARYGVIATIGKGDTEFDDDSELESDFYQLNLYGLYKNNGYDFLITPYIGMVTGDLDRNINIGDISSDTNADVDSNYVGVLAQVSKKYQLQVKDIEFFAKPKFLLNAVTVHQDGVTEDNKDYGVKVNSNDSSSFVTGLGLDFGKDILMKNDYKVSLAATTMYKHEFANPTDPLDVSIQSFGDDNIEMNEYDQEKDYGDVGAKLELVKGEFNSHLKYNYEVGQDTDEQKVTLGLGYKF